MHGRQVGMRAFGANEHTVAIAPLGQPCAQGAFADAARQFGQPIGVDFSGVEKVAAQINKGVKQGEGISLCDGRAEVAGPQAEGGGGEVGVGNWDGFHGLDWVVCDWVIRDWVI